MVATSCLCIQILLVLYTVHEIDLSLAILSGEPAVLRWTFWILAKMSSDEYQPFGWWSICQTLSLIYARWTKCLARSNPFAGHFSKFASYVRWVRRISHTLYYAWIWACSSKILMVKYHPLGKMVKITRQVCDKVFVIGMLCNWGILSLMDVIILK